MKPILYEAGKPRKGNGLGGLVDAIACKTRERRNGVFELEMAYPAGTALHDKLRNGATIVTTPNEVDGPQAFEICRCTDKMDGTRTVYAQHESYRLVNVPVAPFSAGSCQAAMQGLKSNAAESCPFEFWTDKETVADFTLLTPASVRRAIGGQRGSILDTYGGELKWDGTTVKLYKQRGRKTGVKIKYGKNLLDLDQEESIENTVTGVYPYYVAQSGQVTQLPEKVMHAASAGRFAYPRTMVLDCTQEFENPPSEEQLREYAAAYMDRNGVGVPAVSMTIKTLPLWQTAEYAGIAPHEHLALCDTVTVEFEALGVEATAKVVGYVYDVLQERYESLELGDTRRTDLAGQIVEQTRELERRTDPSTIAAAAARASDWITGASGGCIAVTRDANGRPREWLMMDTMDINTARDMWRWNIGGLGFSENGYNGPYKTALTAGGEIVADFITAGALNAGIVTAGVLQDKTGKKFRLDMDGRRLAANFDSLSITGKPVSTEEATAEQLRAYGETVTGQINALQSQIDGQIQAWFYKGEPAADRPPASEWTTPEEKEKHAGDLYYNNDTGHAYRWAAQDGVWMWIEIVDTDTVKALADAKKAQDTADGKRRTFVTQPVPPYDVGDLWTQRGAELLVCSNPKTPEELYSPADWVTAADYTEQAAVAGRNWIHDSTYMVTKATGTCTTTVEAGVVTVEGDPSKWCNYKSTLTAEGIRAIRGKKITVSADIAIPDGLTAEDVDRGFAHVGLNIEYADGKGSWIRLLRCNRGASLPAQIDMESKTISVQMPDKEIKTAQFAVFVQYCTGRVLVKSPKVELGEKKTPWSPAPEDATIEPEAMTPEETFDALTNHGKIQGLFIKDGKFYLNAEQIAAGKIRSSDGKSYFDLETGSSVLRGSFSTLEFQNDTGRYRVYFDGGKISAQRINPEETEWQDVGFIQWNYGIMPPETWIKAGRIDAEGSCNAPGYWVAGGPSGYALGLNENGERCLNCEVINGHRMELKWSGELNAWVWAVP